jgi:hypothetical protein
VTTRLPIAPTRTAFCEARIDVGHILPGRSLYIDGNSKITAGNGTYEEPAPNALSLPAASVSWRQDCPGSTEVCRSSCYVRGLAEREPELYARYRDNAGVITECLSDPMIGFRVGLALATWIRAHASAGFRWHVSGDVWSKAHAAWIVSVCMLAPDVPFWIYTRTLEAVETLSHANNLAVNVSADRENYAKARAIAEYTGARLTYLVAEDDPLGEHEDWKGRQWDICLGFGCETCTGVPHDLPPGSVIFPDYALRGLGLADPTSAPWWRALTHGQRAATCPTDFFGQSEARRCGPCTKCLTP